VKEKCLDNFLKIKIKRKKWRWIFLSTEIWKITDHEGCVSFVGKQEDRRASASRKAKNANLKREFGNNCRTKIGKNNGNLTDTI
jgi:hypothetical protein